MDTGGDTKSKHSVVSEEVGVVSTQNREALENILNKKKSIADRKLIIRRKSISFSSDNSRSQKYSTNLSKSISNVPS